MWLVALLWVKNDLQLKASYGSSLCIPNCWEFIVHLEFALHLEYITHIYFSLMTVLQRVAVFIVHLEITLHLEFTTRIYFSLMTVLQRVAVCCSMLRRVAVCWHGVATICRLLKITGLFCFAEYRLLYRALLQKRAIILRSLLIVATSCCNTHLVLSHEVITHIYISFVGLFCKRDL